MGLHLFYKPFKYWKATLRSPWRCMAHTRTILTSRVPGVAVSPSPSPQGAEQAAPAVLVPTGGWSQIKQRLRAGTPPSAKAVTPVTVTVAGPPAHPHPQLSSAIPSTQLGHLHKNLVWGRERGQKGQEEARRADSTPWPRAVPGSHSQGSGSDLTSPHTPPSSPPPAAGLSCPVMWEQFLRIRKVLGRSCSHVTPPGPSSAPAHSHTELRVGDGEGLCRIMQWKSRGVSAQEGSTSPKTRRGAHIQLQHNTEAIPHHLRLDTTSVKSNQSSQKSTYTMILRILIQGLFHGIWTRLYTTVMPGIPKGGTACPQLHLGLAMCLGESLAAPARNSALE